MRLLKTRDVADMLSCSLDTVHKLRIVGALQAVRLVDADGRCLAGYRFSEQAVHEYLLRLGVAPTLAKPDKASAEAAIDRRSARRQRAAFRRRRGNNAGSSVKTSAP